MPDDTKESSGPDGSGEDVLFTPPADKWTVSMKFLTPAVKSVSHCHCAVFIEQRKTHLENLKKMGWLSFHSVNADVYLKRAMYNKVQV